ncbi:MAG TPA: GDSL-type esterase/lipase family protein [Pirellulaceae bacterium]|nr:GDSL-type esterase/lipase family protein [Pirellulaceae bacterium]
MRATIVLCGIWLLCSPLLAQEQPAAKPFEKWEKAIAAFEAKDAKSPPAKQGMVFVGSSSIVKWDLNQSFPKLPVINRGFGGSQLADSVHFAPRIVLPYEPKIVVLYAGDNDLASGKTPEQVAADFNAFAKLLHDKLPETKLIYIAVKPSVARWKLIEKVRATNKLIAARCAQDEKRLVFLDIDPLMLTASGDPDPALFVKDGLHLSPAGYERWNKALLPLLEGK